MSEPPPRKKARVTHQDSSSAVTLPKEASLLGLPRELRDYIWELAVINAVGPGKILGVLEGPLKPTPPALMYTSSQIRYEFGQILYGKVTFVIRPWRIETSRVYCTWFRGRWMRTFLPATKGMGVRVKIELVFWAPIYAIPEKRRVFELKAAEEEFRGIDTDATAQIVTCFASGSNGVWEKLTLREFEERVEEEYW